MMGARPLMAYILYINKLRLMTKKGELQEIISKALYADDASLYFITYRDYKDYKQINLSDFILISENFQTIPASRIIKIELKGQLLYEKKLK
jgi:uncharacterized protein (UPF0248 family)